MTSPVSGETLKTWIERQYAEEPGLRERVAELVAKMELEQAALREKRGLSMGEGRHR